MNLYCFKLHWSFSVSFNLSNVGKIFWVWIWKGLYSTANDPETANDPQNGPQMILDRKWSLKWTANDPVKTWGMEWILWDWLQKRTDYKKESFFSRLLKKKGRRTLYLRSIYTRWKKKLNKSEKCGINRILLPLSIASIFFQECFIFWKI